MSHFVYIYRDASGKVCYIGYGQSSEAAFARMADTHNKRLRELVNSKSLTLEIAGPFDSQATALAVESALFSAIMPAIVPGADSSTEGARGQTIHRFRPLGVAPQFAERFAMAPLGRDDLIEVLDEANSPSFLCVHVENIYFADDNGILRRGYEPSNPPSDEEIAERVQRFWLLETKLADWQRNPIQSPAILLGIHGDIDNQFVFASMATDRENWDAGARAPEDDALYEVPVRNDLGLDVAGLRGRRIARKTGLKFNADGVKMFP